MRKIYILCLLTLVASALFAQVPQTFEYQTVARNSTGQILENQTVSFRISIIQGELPGRVVYSEIQRAITNENGLVSFTIGQGEAPRGDISAIIPDEATYFIHLEMDTNGGVNYSLLEISRLSGNSREYISPQSINISSGNNPGSNYSIPGENAESLIANISIIDEGTNHDNSAKFTLNQQVVGVPQGWTGLSSYVIPDNPDIESIFLPVQDQLIMLFSDQGVYYPSQQINTLVNWDPQSGYVAKFNQETNLAFSGQLIQNGTISLAAGWNLIPVLTSCPVNVDSLFENYDVTIIKEVADWKLYWPDMGIHTLNELIPGNAYYVLMSTPAEISFPQCIIPEWHCGDILVDTRDSKTYETVQIGAQCWMGQNLNFGSNIDGASEQTDNEIIEKYCYNNNVANCNEYGGLYQWDEMMQYSSAPGVSGICPPGWYLPDDAEWNELTDYLGGLAVAGGKMKEVGTIHWSSPNTGATNSSGFTGLPGGFRGNDGSFNNIGFYGNFWTASKTDATSSKRRYMTWNSAQVTQNSINKLSGLSVRCRRDDPETSVLMVNPENLTVSFDQGEVTFDVTSNTAWIVESNQPWLTITPASGINDQILTVNYEANEGADSRVGEIIFTAVSGFPMVTVTLIQAGLAWTCGQPFVDERDGSTYNTVQVGTQCWMAQNLNVGSSLDISSDQTDNGVIERYCYDNNNANCNIYGGLYQWDEMMQYSIGNGVKGICPESWHVPGLIEWDQLCNFLGGYAVAGGKMKETGTIEEGTGLWHTPNTGATNSSGMTVLPSGYRLPDSLCYDMGYFTILWSSGLNTYLPVTFALFSEGQDVMTFESELNYGNAVRCIKDADTHAFTLISPPRQYVAYPAGSATFSVNANTSWTVSEAVTWLSVEPAGGSNNGTISVNYDQNPTPITRTGIIEVFDGINLFELMIIQDRFIPELSVSPANQDVPPAGGIVNFDVSSNTTWNVTESVSWLTVSPASGSNNGTLAVSCEANGTNDTRTGTITITAAAGTPVVTVTVTQVASVLTVSPVNQEVTTAAGTTIFSVSSNTNWIVNESVSWFSVSPLSGNNNGTLIVTYDENTGADPRIGQITISAAGGTPLVIVTISQISTISNCGQPFTDTRDGQSYATVQIGMQCWMAQNLNIGTPINGSSNQTNNTTIEKYCYNNIESNCGVYGGFYQFYEMMQYSFTPGVQGICPQGWHVPTDEEWCTMTTYMDASVNCSAIGWTGTDAGGKMKTTGTIEAGTGLWYSPNTAATNSSGFTGLPNGIRNIDGSFTNQGFIGYWWSSTESDATRSWYRYLSFAQADVHRNRSSRYGSYAVRCLKDEATTSQLEVNPANQNISASAGVTYFAITSNTSWAVTENNTWLTVSPLSGSNNGTLTVSFDTNTSNNPRTGQIIITATGGTPAVTVTITQAGAIIWSCGQPITDERDSKTYTTVQIGDQCWIAQNLNIGNRIDGINEQTNNGTIEKYCYNNLESNCDVYGGLYQWDEMMQYSTTPGVQGICPAGWHVPTNTEFSALTEYLGGESVAGGKLKESGTIYWNSPNTGATNSSGFTALPGGSRYTDGTFHFLGIYGNWWSSTQYNTSNIWYRYLAYNYASGMGPYYYGKLEGFSVRCLKDDNTSSQLEVTPSNQNVSATAGVTNFSIISNTAWSVTENNTWLSVSPMSGSNNGTLTVSYDANTSTDSRTGQIIITATGGTPAVTVTVTQAGAIIWNCGETFTDERDSKTYTTVQIGDQCWMQQNLNIGTRINGTRSQTDNGTLEKYCYYNSEAQCDVYGGLYQWDEMMQYITTPGLQGICPAGWHVPTDAEWTKLTNYVSSQPEFWCNGDSTYIAKSLASVINWSASWDTCTPGINFSANNATGFTGLPGGIRWPQGDFAQVGDRGWWWVSADYQDYSAWYRNLDRNYTNLFRSDGGKVYGMSVRCLKGELGQELNAGPDQIWFTYQAGYETLYINSTTSWIITEEVPWLSIFPMSGAYNDTISISYDENTSQADREGQITISSTDGTLTTNIRVYQEGFPAVIVTPEYLEVSYEAGTATFEIASNESWWVFSDDPWLTVTPESGSLNATLTVNYEANTSPDYRYGYMYFFSENSDIQYITIFQEGHPLVVTPSNYDVTAEAGSVNFEIISSTSWAVAESVAWLSVSPMSGSNNGTLTVSYVANASIVSRIGQITITASDGTPVVTVSVTQAGAVPTLNIIPANQNVTATAGTTAFEVTSNTTWTVAESVSWFSVSPANGTNNETLSVNYDANTSAVQRTGQIIITAGGGTPVVTVTVTQAGASYSCGQPITDSRDGKTYNTLLIGSQCWMAQNLNVGTRISGSSNQTNNSTIEKYCYNNTESNCTTYGGLYQWNEMMQYSTNPGVQGICPAGWHVPTDAEWTALTNYVSSQTAWVCGGNTSYIAKALASATGWNSYSGTCAVGNNQASNNATGFTGLPGGLRSTGGSFGSQAYYGYWWSSSQGDASYAWGRYLYYGYATVPRLSDSKANGFSIRCLKD